MSNDVRIAVLVKSVPLGDPKLAEPLVTDGTERLDPVNEPAINWAFRQRRAGLACHVAAVGMGSLAAVGALRRARALGCDEMHLIVTDPGADAPVGVTAGALAEVIRRLRADLALFGYESSDASSGTVPAAVAALLDWPLISRCATAELQGDQVAAERDLGDGPELAVARLPTALSFVAGSDPLPHPSLKRLMAARGESPILHADSALPVHIPAIELVGVEEQETARTSPKVLDLADGGAELVRLATAVASGFPGE